MGHFEDERRYLGQIDLLRAEQAPRQGLRFGARAEHRRQHHGIGWIPHRLEWHRESTPHPGLDGLSAFNWARDQAQNRLAGKYSDATQ